ncbi:hypothetical protein [Olsenella phocaeensis]|nr:hypothetical protein [Olsenella phocaeensis]
MSNRAISYLFASEDTFLDRHQGVALALVGVLIVITGLLEGVA